jgi:hypothetical protein
MYQTISYRCSKKFENIFQIRRVFEYFGTIFTHTQHSLVTYILHITEEIRIRKLSQTLKVVFQIVGALSQTSETFSPIVG